MPVRQNGVDTDAGASDGGVEDTDDSLAECRGRLVTDGGSVVERTEVDPDSLEAHPKNREIYGDDPDIDGMVTDMEAEGYDEGSVITVNSADRVVKGHRRWAAAREVGVEAVPVIRREYDSEDDEEAALLLDNLLQRDQTFSQKMREAAELERIKEEGADSGGPQTEIVEEFLESGEGRTRDRVAAAVNIGSGETYRRAKRVWERAEDGDDEAADEVALIDEGEQSIHGAFTALHDDAGSDDDGEDEGETGAIGGDDEIGAGADKESSSTGTGDADRSGIGGETGGGISDSTEESIDVTDENPPSPAELDDRDDPSEEMGMGRGSGGSGGVGEDAAKSSGEMAAEEDEAAAADIGGSESSSTSAPDDAGSSEASAIDGEATDDVGGADEEGQVIGEDDLVIDGDLAARVRGRADENDISPEKMLDSLITDGKPDGDGALSDVSSEAEGDDGAEADGGERMTLNLDEDEEAEVEARANELGLEPEEVVNRLVGAWVSGDEAPFEAS